jgi:hypothetical protein
MNGPSLSGSVIEPMNGPSLSGSVIEPRAIAIMFDSSGLSGAGWSPHPMPRPRLGSGSENAIAVVITVSLDEPQLVR